MGVVGTHSRSRSPAARPGGHHPDTPPAVRPCWSDEKTRLVCLRRAGHRREPACPVTAPAEPRRQLLSPDSKGSRCGCEPTRGCLSAAPRCHAQARPTSATGRRHGLGRPPREGTGSPLPRHPTPLQHTPARRPAYVHGVDSRPRQCTPTSGEAVGAARQRGLQQSPAPGAPSTPSACAAPIRGGSSHVPRVSSARPHSLQAEQCCCCREGASVTHQGGSGASGRGSPGTVMLRVSPGPAGRAPPS